MPLQLVPLREKLQIGGTNSRSPAVLAIPSTSALHVGSLFGPMHNPAVSSQNSLPNLPKELPNK